MKGGIKTVNNASNSSGIETPEASDEIIKEELVEEVEKQKQEEDTLEENNSNTNQEDSKRMFKKEKKQKKDQKDLKIEELTDKYTRLMAEFENFRKRTDKEKSAMYEIGAKSIVEKILPVIDNFERGLGTVEPDQAEDPFVSGMDMVYKQMLTSLEEAGVKPIEAVGSEFNPELHNAVMHVEDEEQKENVIVEEFQKGYMYRESVVRYSMVKVAN